MLENPCKDCIERHLGCHGQCKRYLSWQKEHNALKRYIAKQSYNENVIGWNDKKKGRKKER